MDLSEFLKLPHDEQVSRFDELSHADKMKVGERSRTVVTAKRDQYWAWAHESRRIIESVASEPPEHPQDEFIHKLCKVIDFELKWRLVDGMRQMIEEVKQDLKEPT